MVSGLQIEEKMALRATAIAKYSIDAYLFKKKLAIFAFGEFRGPRVWQPWIKSYAFSSMFILDVTT